MKKNLKDVVKKLEEVGWRQGSNKVFVKTMCLMEAIEKTVGHYQFHSDLLQKILGKEPTRWNDDKGRTFEEVKALLLSVEYEWEEEENAV